MIAFEKRNEKHLEKTLSPRFRYKDFLSYLEKAFP